MFLKSVSMEYGGPDGVRYEYRFRRIVRWRAMYLETGAKDMHDTGQ